MCVWVGGSQDSGLEHHAHTALRLRLAWRLHMAANKPWSSLGPLLSEEERALLNAAARVQVGNGKNTYFWTDRWMFGLPLDMTAPRLHNFQLSPEVEDGWTWSLDAKGCFSTKSV